MNKLLKSFICIFTILCCVLSFAANTTNGNEIFSVKIEPQKDTYYVGETVKLILSLKVDEENAEIEDINIIGLDNLSYANIGKFSNVKPDTTSKKQTYSFTSNVTFTDPEETTLNLEAIYNLSFRQTQYGIYGSSYIKTIEPQQRAKAKPYFLSIKELPTPPSDQFSGIIGSATTHTKLSTNVAYVGDIITLRTAIETTDFNNKDSLSCSVEHMENFMFYPEKILDRNLSSTGYSYTIEQKIVPNTQGNFTISPPKVLYFDTIAGDYKIATDKNADEESLTIIIKERKVEKVEDIIPTDSNLSKASSTINLDIKTIDPNGEYQTIDTVQQAKLAPSIKALTIFEIPANSQITILEQHGGWCRVNYNKAFGWIPATAIKSRE